MSDLISRQAVLDWLKNEWNGMVTSLFDGIKALPSAQPDTDRIYAELSKAYNVKGLPDEAIGIIGDLMLSLDTPSTQPEQRWIPCSESLPDHLENDDYYLVTIQCEHYDGWDDYVTGFAEWTKYGWDELSCYIGQIKVIAWMPLPEPYQAERREE